MKQMLKPFLVIVLLTTIFIACKKGVEDNPPVNKLTASFSVKGDGAQGPCSDTFTVTSTGAERYSWKFGDGSVAMGTDKTVTHLYNGSTSQDTTYTVTLTAYAGKDSAMATKTLVVKKRMPIPAGQKPIVNFTIKDLDKGNFEVGSTITFTDSSQYGESYAWNFGNGITSKAKDTAITYTAANSYNITLTVTNVNGSTSKTLPVKINAKGVEPLPENVDFSFTPANPKVGDTITFMAALNITHAAKYIWQFNDGSADSSGVTTIKHAYTTAKDYTITLFVRNNAGAEVRKDTLISVLDIAPTASFTVSAGPYSISKPITFTSTSTPATGLSYKWVFGDGDIDSTSGATVQHAYKEGGDKTVTLYVKNSAGSRDYTYQIPDIQANKVTITKIDLINAPLFYYDGGSKYTWDQRSFGTGDYDGSEPDFSLQVFYNGGIVSYTSIYNRDQINPSWDFSRGGTVPQILYSKADFFTSHFIYLIENSFPKAGLPALAPTRNACDNITFKPGDYVKGLMAYPASIVIYGTSPDKDKQTVAMRLHLKWE